MSPTTENSAPRVLITGLGPVTAFGVGIEPLWQALIEGQTALKPITRFSPDAFPCSIAAELSDDQFTIRSFVPKSYRKATKVMCRDIELAVAAAASAVADARLVTKAIDPEATPTIAPDRMGCHIGAGLIAADIDELSAALVTSKSDDGTVDLAEWGRSGMNNLTPLWLLKYLPNMLACHVTIIHDCQGPSNTITCCEASSGLSLGESVRVIARGAADACLTGGAEYKINPMAMFRQQAAQRLVQGSDPASIQPFGAHASGTALGEGGGILVVESAASAKARGAEPYAEVAGFASTQSHSNYDLTFAIDPDDPGISDAIELALEQAGITPSDVDAIAPMASGIAHFDHAEAAAIQRVFGDRAADIPIITTIPNTGHCNAGQGAITLAVSAKAIKEQMLPARINTTDAVDLNANACEARSAQLRHVLVFTTSQGGQNAAVVLRAC